MNAQNPLRVPIDSPSWSLPSPSGLRERARRLGEDLERQGFFKTGSPALRILLADYRSRKPFAAPLDLSETLRSLLQDGIDRAASFGIERDRLVLQFVSLTFRHGIDWVQDETLRVYLESKILSEEQKLSHVLQALELR